MTINAAFQWKCQPKAESLIIHVLEKAVQANSFIATLSGDLLQQTSTRLFDWLDHVVVGHSLELEKELEESGFVSELAMPSYRVFHHPGAQLPRIVVKDHDQDAVSLAISVDSIADFLMVRGMTAQIEGGSYSKYRRCCISSDNNASLSVVERRGTLSMEPVHPEKGYLEKYFEAKEKWETRPRSLENEDEMMSRSLSVAKEMVELVGEDLAAWIVMEVERKYWQSRNTAGQIQKNRQDRLGMGWANHDHHTFRSSRRYFAKLVRLFEILGFHCRERFYAGQEAGWGAQVMENPKCKLILFLDVDLDPEELEIDFAHLPLPELKQLGTIGLWCELHGDSILKAGMHHLEAQFMFEDLTRDLASSGVGMMEPFSNFPYLKQAFTSGEIWRVEPYRVQKLVDRKKISQEQADKFLLQGALGSHLENLQRREGYKGFNQKNVSFIIKKTDPRLTRQGDLLHNQSADG